MKIQKKIDLAKIQKKIEKIYVQYREPKRRLQKMKKYYKDLVNTAKERGKEREEERYNNCLIDKQDDIKKIDQFLLRIQEAEKVFINIINNNTMEVIESLKVL